MTTQQSVSKKPEFSYANFILRLGAFVIDMFILGFIISIVQWLLVKTFSINLRMEDFISDDQELILTPLFTMSFLIYTSGKLITFWLYYALLETRLGATPGKLLLKLQVTDSDGRRIGFARATGHAFGRILAILPFLTGYLMAAFTDKTQALHDLMAGCIVIPAREAITTTHDEEAIITEQV